MSIDAVIAECQSLVEAYVEAEKGVGRMHAEERRSGPELLAARASFERLRLKTNCLHDLGRGDLAYRFLLDASNHGTKASIESQRAALREMVTP